MRLPERDRELLLLVAWDGLSIEDAAKVLACSHGAAHGSVDERASR